MPVEQCSNGKYRIGDGECVYNTERAANRAYQAYLAIEASEEDDDEYDDDDDDMKAIVNAIIRMASSLGLQTIAEGVETREQLEALRAQGCDEVQGFLYAKPMPSSALLEFLRTNKKVS